MKRALILSTALLTTAALGATAEGLRRIDSAVLHSDDGDGRADLTLLGDAVHGDEPRQFVLTGADGARVVFEIVAVVPAAGVTHYTGQQVDGIETLSVDETLSGAQSVWDVTVANDFLVTHYVGTVAKL